MLAKGLGLAFMLELGALATLLANPRSTPALLVALGLHAVASLVLALIVWRTLPANWRQVKWHGISLLFAVNLFVPALALGLRLAVTAAKVFAKITKTMPISEVSDPVFTVSQRQTGDSFRGGKIRAKLTDEQVPAAMRLSALLAIQDAPARYTADIMRNLLADSLDDIRLLAYGMLDGKEKEISHRIYEEKQQLDKLTTNEERYACNRKLAELNYELIHQRLVSGDVRNFSAQQSKDYAQNAIDIAPADSGLWYLMGKVALVRNQLEEAEQCFEKAGEFGFPRERIAPYAAECAFRRRDLPRVRQLFHQAHIPPGALQLAAVHRYWRGETR
jgi:polysaccharide biosynthesis protein PelE